MSNVEIFEKKIKGTKGKLIVALVLLAMCIINEFSFYMVMQDVKKNPVAFSDVSKVGEYSCIDVRDISDGFADYSNDDSTSMSAYYAIDEENLYIISLNKEEYKKFDEIVDYWVNGDEDAKEPDPVRVCGLTETIPSNLRSLAVEYYNEMFPDNTITNTQFSQYFEYYLNTDRGPEEDFMVSSMAAGVFLIIALIFLALYINDKRKTKKTMAKYANEMDAIKMEISAPDTLYEKKAKVFLTANRIINVSSGMEIYDYKDIIWVYPHELRQNGYTTQKSIYVVTKDNKAHIIANISMSKKNNVLFDEIYESLMLKMPDALHGYTKENREKVKEMTKKK